MKRLYLVRLKPWKDEEETPVHVVMSRSPMDAVAGSANQLASDERRSATLQVLPIASGTRLDDLPWWRARTYFASMKRIVTGVTT